MSTDKLKQRGKRETKIAKGQEVEVQHLTETTDLSANQAKTLLQRHGNDWARIRDEAEHFKVESSVPAHQGRSKNRDTLFDSGDVADIATVAEDDVAVAKKTTGSTSTITSKIAKKEKSLRSKGPKRAAPAKAKPMAKAKPKKKTSDTSSIAAIAVKTARATLKQVKTLASSVLGQDKAKGKRNKT
jgi:hypothetical protein